VPAARLILIKAMLFINIIIIITIIIINQCDKDRPKQDGLRHFHIILDEVMNETK